MQIRVAALILLLIFTTVVPSKAQTFYDNKEYGISLGGSQYFGDLNEHYGFQYVRPAGGAFLRIHVNPFIAVRISALYTKVGYDDKFSNSYYTKKRNLNFRSDIMEGGVQAEFNFFRFFTGELNSRFTPYLTGGLSVMYYDPYTTVNGVKYYLRPLGTEGQNNGLGGQYTKFSMCAPVGAGFKYWLRPGLNFGFEIANRLTFTDYLDDVSQTYAGTSNFDIDASGPSLAYQLQDRSVELGGQPLGRAGKQRGNSATKDQYLTFMFNISFQLKTYKCPAYLKQGFYNLNN